MTMYSCRKCIAAFERIQKLAKHYRDEHKDRKCYKCSQCSADFKLCSDLKRHEETHLEVKTFGCHACNVFFQTSMVLRKHQKSLTCKAKCEKLRMDIKLESMIERRENVDDYIAQNSNDATFELDPESVYVMDPNDYNTTFNHTENSNDFMDENMTAFQQIQDALQNAKVLLTGINHLNDKQFATIKKDLLELSQTVDQIRDDEAEDSKYMLSPELYLR